MNERLSARQVQSYREDGILFPVKVLDMAEIAVFRSAFEGMEQYESPLKYVAHPHLFFFWAYELATHCRVVDVVEQILGPEILVEGTVIMAKYPSDGTFVPWHQDGEYSGWYKTPSVSAWIALSDSHRENGCMRVIPGSHREGRQPHGQAIHENSLLQQRGTEIEVEVDETLAIDVELKAGELSLHDSSIIHGSSPNHSNTHRVGFVVRFVTPAFQSRIQQHPMIRARGTADCGALPLLATPPSGEFGACFGRWRAAFPPASPANVRQNTIEATGAIHGR